jgi:ADP-heptose:LPS heptosyltransferase
MVGLGGKYLDLYKNVEYIDEIHQMPFDIETLKTADYHLHFEQIIEGNPKAERTNAYDLFLEKFKFDPAKINTADKVPDIYLTTEEKKWAEDRLERFKVKETDILIGIQIAASSPIRSFPDDKTITIANMILNEENGKVILFGSTSQNQAELAQNMKHSLPKELHEKIIVSAEEKFTLRQSMAITRHCDMIIAPDSAMIHIAGALRVPILGLYGPFPADLRMRYYYNAIALNACPSCAPCFIHDHDPCPKGSPSPCFSLVDINQIMFAVEYLLNKSGNKSMPTIVKLKKSIFNQVINKARPYMNGKGLDIGCGFQIYPSELDITKIDVNPLVDPDLVANFFAPNFEIDEPVDYIISSYSINTIPDLMAFMEKANDTLKVDGHIILFIGDANVINKASGKKILTKYLLDYLKSELTNDIITSHLNEFDNFEIIEMQLPSIDEGKEALEIFETNHGIFIVLRKTHEAKYEKIIKEDGTEIYGIEESE